MKKGKVSLDSRGFEVGYVTVWKQNEHRDFPLSSWLLKTSNNQSFVSSDELSPSAFLSSPWNLCGSGEAKKHQRQQVWQLLYPLPTRTQVTRLITIQTGRVAPKSFASASDLWQWDILMCVCTLGEEDPFITSNLNSSYFKTGHFEKHIFYKFFKSDTISSNKRD